VPAIVSPRQTTAEVNGIEAFPAEVEVNCGWGGYHDHHRRFARAFTNLHSMSVSENRIMTMLAV